MLIKLINATHIALVDTKGLKIKGIQKGLEILIRKRNCNIFETKNKNKMDILFFLFVKLFFFILHIFRI